MVVDGYYVLPSLNKVSVLFYSMKLIYWCTKLVLRVHEPSGERGFTVTITILRLSKFTKMAGSPRVFYTKIHHSPADSDKLSLRTRIYDLKMVTQFSLPSLFNCLYVVFRQYFFFYIVRRLMHTNSRAVQYIIKDHQPKTEL